MKVFVTGVEGYIGSLLAPLLVQHGHEVVGTDTGYYRDGWLYSDSKTLSCFPKFLNRDLRSITQADLEVLMLSFTWPNYPMTRWERTTLR